MRWPPTNRPTFSLLQVMKLVVFCAVAFGCVAPMLQLWRVGVVQGGTPQGLVLVVLFEAIVVPLAWVGLCFVLLGRGPLRDRVITGLLLAPVAIAFGFACWLLMTYTVPAFGNLYDPPEKRVGVRFVTMHLLAILTLAAAAFYLSIRLRPENSSRTTT